MRERDPMLWAFPLPWRPLGVTVKVHLLFPAVVAGLLLWVGTSPQFAPGLWVHASVALLILFVAVLLHELGHVWGARRVDGDAMEIMLWPLGGLTFADVPQTPRAHFWTTAFGPAVNLFLALAAGIALVALGFVPPLNPLSSPFNPRMFSWREGVTYFSVANPGEAETWRFVNPETQKPEEARLVFEKLPETKKIVVKDVKPADVNANVGDEPKSVYELKNKPTVQVQPAQLSKWQWLLAQFFVVNWFLFVINLLPAFPLDGARLLQCFLWRRSDYRQATATAAYVGLLMMIGVGIYAIALNEILPFGLALLIYWHCRMQLLQLEQLEEASGQGYDFSQGYASLEREDAPPPPRPKPNWFQRWRQRRGELRRRREQQQRETEEHRLDELLDKIHRQGKQALTEDELRFLTRMSSRYPNKKAN